MSTRAGPSGGWRAFLPNVVDPLDVVLHHHAANRPNISKRSNAQFRWIFEERGRLLRFSHRCLPLGVFSFCERSEMVFRHYSRSAVGERNIGLLRGGRLRHADRRRDASLGPLQHVRLEPARVPIAHAQRGGEVIRVEDVVACICVRIPEQQRHAFRIEVTIAEPGLTCGTHQLVEFVEARRSGRPAA
jgi:hypothetical protein